MSEHRVFFGDVLDVLRGLDAGSVDCCACSPPYWGLRDYGVEGQIGLEATPEAYVARLVAVFAEVRRVLKPGGVVFVNLGDSYASGGRTSYDDEERAEGRGHSFRPGAGRADGVVDERGQRNRNGTPPTHGLKPKDLCGIPWRVAFALQADGWWLRNDIIWAKSNPMPSSVTDRFSSTYEHVFLLAKAARYWFDLDACREPHADDWHSRASTWRNGDAKQQQDAMYHPFAEAKPFANPPNPLGKNPGDVWRIATQPTPYAHFATWPEALVERMLLAGCPPKVCAECGVPWEHRVEKTGLRDHPLREKRTVAAQQFAAADNEYRDGGTLGKVSEVADLGYHAACACDAPALPGTVLDPFLGSGTTTQVARKLGRRSIGIELNPRYEQVMRQRLGCEEGALFADVTFEQAGQMTLLGEARP